MKPCRDLPIDYDGLVNRLSSCFNSLTKNISKATVMAGSPIIVILNISFLQICAAFYGHYGKPHGTSGTKYGMHRCCEYN